MPVGFLVYLVLIGFWWAIGWPATKLTVLIFDRLGILPEREKDFSKREKYDRLYWSVFFYYCVVIFAIEQYMYSLIKYGETNILLCLLILVAATIVIFFRVYMVLNEDKLLPKAINAFGRFLLVVWIVILLICLIAMAGVFLYNLVS